MTQGFYCHLSCLIDKCSSCVRVFFTSDSDDNNKHVCVCVCLTCVVTCMTVPYFTTSPWTFLFSVSFCFCSRLEACCNTNTRAHTHTLVFTWFRHRLPVTQKSLTRCKVKCATPDQVKPVEIRPRAFPSVH